MFCKVDRVHCHKLMLTKTALIFVSPGGVKMGTLLITRDDRNNYSTQWKAVICSLLIT